MTYVQRSALAVMIVLIALLNPTRGQDRQHTEVGQPWLFSGKEAPISSLIRDADKKALRKRAVSSDILRSYLDELLRLLNAQRDSWAAGLSTLNSLVTRVQAMKCLDLLNQTDGEAPGMEVDEQVTIPAWFTQRTQLCYQWYADDDGGQCGGGADRLLCAAPGNMTSYYRDDTDRRPGGCQMQWGVITSGEADWFRQVQVCFRWYPDGDGGQCGGGAAQELCAPVNSYTPYYRDDTDERGGGCQMSWRLVVPSNAPAWALNLQLCYVWYPDGDGGQCGGGASSNLCARANDWTAYYRDDTDIRPDITKMKTMSSSRGLNVCRFLSFCALVSFGALTIMAHMIWYRHFPSPLPAPAVRENSVLHTTTGLFVTEAKKMMTVSSVVHNSSAPLDEFQSILDETVHQLLLLKNSRDEARLPVVTAVKCSSLWEDNKEELERAIPLVNTTRSRAKSVRDYLYDTENCKSYLLHTGFKRALVSELEKFFPLAFSLMVYKDAAQVERLLRAVYRPHNVYCVHVDRKSDDAFHTSIRLMISCLPNVVLADKSFGVEWGTATVLLPELECMKRLWDHSTKWRYFINLTGQEFPLKTNRELVTILRAFDGANDIGLEQDPSFVYRWKKQVPAPHNLTVTKAPVHIVASRGYVDYVLHSRVAREFLQWILPSSIPDESFFGTLNSNPHLGVPGSYLGTELHRHNLHNADVSNTFNVQPF